MHADPKNPKKNPHPVKRYELTATAEAPGPWDKVDGLISYEVVNPGCTPEDKFLGVHDMPQNVDVNIEMTRTGENTWKGYFYRDYLQGDDYYGLGICHWDTNTVGAGFTVHGETFGIGRTLNMFLGRGARTDYFKKSEYFDRSLKGSAVWATTGADDPDVTKHPDHFFPITIAIKEVSP